MKCSWCGGEVKNGSLVCPLCDAPFDACEVENSLAEERFYEKKRDRSKSTILTLGIISLILDYIWIFSPIGLVLSIIAKVLLGGYKKRYGEIDGKAKAGSVLSTIGLILGIILAVVLIFYGTLIFIRLSDLSLPDVLPEDVLELFA